MPTSNTTAKNVALDVAFFVSICFILLQNVADGCVLLQQILVRSTGNRAWSVGWVTETEDRFFCFATDAVGLTSLSTKFAPVASADGEQSRAGRPSEAERQ